MSIAETLKTVLIEKLKSRNTKELGEIEAWSGKITGAAGNQKMDALFRIPSHLEEIIRRASGKDGIYFERKMDTNERQNERKARPLIAIPQE